MKTRVGVIGVGHLGQHHVRLLSAMPDVDLVGVVDIDRARADERAGQYRTTVVDSPAALLAGTDAVVIASPTVSHIELALPFVEAGKAVLVEKPIADSLDAADRLLAFHRATRVHEHDMHFARSGRAEFARRAHGHIVNAIAVQVANRCDGAAKLITVN